MEKIFSLAEIEQVAFELLPLIREKKVVAFHGEMGAGKTTLIKTICKQLGTDDVTGSPTFSLINQYNTRDGNIIYHMDWYRVASEEEAIQAGIEDALYSGNYCLVEWPEKAPGLLPDEALHLRINTLGESERKLSWEV